MATLRQKRLAKELVDNMQRPEPLTATELLEKSGYTEITARSSQKDILERDGVQEALVEYGFSLDEADKTVARILKSGKEENQIKAAQEIYKRLGGYAPEKSQNVNVNVNANLVDDKFEQIRQEYEAKLKEKFLEK